MWVLGKSRWFDPCLLHHMFPHRDAPGKQRKDIEVKHFDGLKNTNVLIEGYLHILLTPRVQLNFEFFRLFHLCGSERVRCGAGGPSGPEQTRRWTRSSPTGLQPPPPTPPLISDIPPAAPHLLIVVCCLEPRSARASVRARASNRRT